MNPKDCKTLNKILLAAETESLKELSYLKKEIRDFREILEANT